MSFSAVFEAELTREGEPLSDFLGQLDLPQGSTLHSRKITFVGRVSVIDH